MAVDSGSAGGPAGSLKRTLVGGNVLLATLLVIAIVGVLQAIAFSVPNARIDMTSTRVNSLSDATSELLNGLEQPVTLTSLYFETDIEEKDQSRYRRAVKDLLTLYESTARAKVTAEMINPLSDHEQLAEFKARLRDKPRFKEEIEAYRERIDVFTGELDDKMRALIHGELEAIDGLPGSGAGETSQAVIGQVQTLLDEWSRRVQEVREQIDALTRLDNAEYSGAVAVLKSHYRDYIKSLQDIAAYGKAQLTRNPDLPEPVAKFLSEAGSRYAELVGELEAESTTLGTLEPLEFDELMQRLAPDANPVVVETPEDALVVEFTDIWPPLDQNMGGRAKFKDRAFKGEEKITSAILRVTHQEQTAVVFVRYGGTPLVTGGAIPGQPRPPANYIVKEWDLKSQNDPPTIEPEPTRIIYVVLQPSPPPTGPMGRRSQEPPFTDAHRQTLLSALGDDGRALFVAGWFPGPFGAVPAKYEYGQYLNETWGIAVDTNHRLIEVANFEPGKYGLTQQSAYVREVEVRDHPIVSGPQAQLLALPNAAPLELADTPPDGVEFDPLVVAPENDETWGIENVQGIQQKLMELGYLTQDERDVSGPFLLAAAGEKGDAKIVVVSSSDFATDDTALAQGFVMTSQGFGIRSLHPGNVTLLINSLHWLDDNTEFMNIGQPIDASVLAIKKDSTRKAIQTLTIFVWPALALAFGGLAWWTRRR